MQDFRQTGPPADIGTFLFPTDVMVFKHAFAGVTYAVAIRRGERGWVAVDIDTVANIASVINNAFAALTAGRTWKEKVTVMGGFTGVAQIIIPDYVHLEIIGSLTAVDGLDLSLIVNSGATDIEISGGKIDANTANQTADHSCIYFNTVTNAWIHHVTVIGGARLVPGTARGEGIEFYGCTDGIISSNNVSGAEYDGIKVRTGSVGCIVISNTLDVPAASGSAGIQVSGTATQFNVVGDNTITCNGAGANAGIKLHYADWNVIAHNTVRGTGYAGADLIDNADYNDICDNQFYYTVAGIQTRKTNATVPKYNTFRNNMIFMPTGTVYGLDLADGEDNTIEHNTIVGFGVNSVGIRIQAGVLRTELHRNKFLGAWGTRITDNGTDTRFDTIPVPFRYGSDPQLVGYLVDGAAETASTTIQLPKHVHEIVKITVWARSQVAEADKMRGDLLVSAGADNEGWQTHSQAFADEPSVTLNFAVNDNIHWSLSHANLTAMSGGDEVYVRIQHEAAGDGDCETNATMRSIVIHYV